ncbi:hypothetical protein LY76DRAFT_592565 [Colletotrichum caudatum]|nr:hypothetical protein LY76DRAFT_592565 [Colletotrichum caudatum]
MHSGDADYHGSAMQHARSEPILSLRSILFSAPTRVQPSPAQPSLTRQVFIQGLPSPTPPPTVQRPPAPFTLFVIPPGFLDESGFGCLYRG